MTALAAIVWGLYLAIPLGQAFDGTAVPLMTGVSVFIAGALVLMQLAGPGRQALQA